MVVRELLTVLNFKADENAVKSFDESVKKLTIGLTAVVGAATAAATAAFSFAKGSAEYAMEIDKASKLTNTSTDEFQKYAYAAKSVGIEQDKLADILKDVNDKMGDYAQTGGGAMADFFEFIAPKVGVTAEQFKSLSGKDALGLYVSSLEKANLSQQDMTFYMEAIASDSTMLLPLLEKNSEALNRMGQEADALGLILPKEVIERNKAFNLQLKGLFALVESLSIAIGSELVPVFSDLVKQFTAFMMANGALIKTKLKQFFETAIWIVKQFISVISTLIGWINNIIQSLGGWERVLKIVGLTLAGFLAVGLAAWIWKAVIAMRALSVAILANPAALVVAGAVALMAAIMLLLEDMWQFVNGNESITGDLIAMWFDTIVKFKAMWNEFTNYLGNLWDGTIEGLKGTWNDFYDYVIGLWEKIKSTFTIGFESFKNLMPDFGFNLFGNKSEPSPDSIMGNSNTQSNITDNRTVNVTVPPGTNQEQADYIASMVQRSMGQQITDAAINLEGY